MSRKFQCRAIPSTWLENNGRRLDCGPYLSGAIEARELLKKHPNEMLKDLTAGHNGGIFNGPRFPRTYVDDPRNGIPFLGSTDMLYADLSSVPLLSKKQVQGNPDLLLDEGWTLITCSGSIGRMAYARSDMKGLAGSQHFMRVVPNAEKIKSGYLFAYLSSRFGVPLVVSGTYGAIIQHIEPHHISDLPVPRIGEAEERAHEMIKLSAKLRVEATNELNEIKVSLEEEIGGGPVSWQHDHPQSHAIQAIAISSTLNRLDAFHHVGYVGEAIKKATVPLTEVGNYARALRPPILKRIKVDGTGIDFLGGRELLKLDQSAEDQIAFRTPNLDQFIVKPNMVLFQCVGQRYGIFGTPVLANRSIVGRAVTEAVMRLIPHDPEDAGYIFTYLSTGFGRRLVMRHSASTSIPVLQEDGASKILIYWPEKARRLQLHEIAANAWEKRARAIELEDQARSLVERTIEEGGR
jgi:type I restriction enzyme S subunit